jgi:small subunit ribosomal protein S7
VDLPKILVFNKYDTAGITVPDVGLARYINLAPYSGVPHHAGRHANTHFAKMKIPLVERLINHMMRSEEWTGKKLSAYRLVKDAFKLVEERTKENPVQVLVNAICNVAPKEETTRLRYGGINVPKAVDTAPQRRLDLSIRFLATGAVNASYRNAKPAHVCLADEIIKASKNDMSSFAMSQKDEVERVAKSAR